MLRNIGFVLVLIMAIIQGFYGVYALVDPVAFAETRGTLLASVEDTDWVQIYASRTLFVALIVGFLLYLKQVKLLVAAALFGTVMPISDAWLAYQAGAPIAVTVKHVATLIYLLVTAFILFLSTKTQKI